MRYLIRFDVLFLPSWSSRALIVFRTVFTAFLALRALSSASLALSDACRTVNSLVRL